MLTHAALSLMHKQENIRVIKTRSPRRTRRHKRGPSSNGVVRQMSTRCVGGQLLRVHKKVESGPLLYVTFLHMLRLLHTRVKRSAYTSCGSSRKAQTKSVQPVCRDYTLHLHKLVHGIQFKKRAPRALREIRRFAEKTMQTKVGKASALIFRVCFDGLIVPMVTSNRCSGGVDAQRGLREYDRRWGVPFVIRAEVWRAVCYVMRGLHETTRIVGATQSTRRLCVDMEPGNRIGA
ncbi:unnamed protein product [Rangifer tarandus platyrhynchus]|uniref:Uncharacterized protein n=1 Tax=Rangifer tarandus platyrhynchus TaxID=3082113 RepID=A0ABN8XJD0_RANTA|nr:unnamed protein product [Rangifer tarandus platyrhynchus]